MRLVLAPCATLALLAVAACKPTTSRLSIGPAGGVLTSDDEVLTVVLWPGALGEWQDFEITQTAAAPESFGPAYAVSPNPELGIDAVVILRGDLPTPTKLARVGAIAGNAEAWTTLPLEPEGINEADDTVRGHDQRVSAIYAMLDTGDVMGGTTTATDTGTTETGDPTTTPVSFATDVQPIFDANCLQPAGCHGQSPSGGLALDTDALAHLVGVPATIDGSLFRVVSGNADDSLLMNKVDFMPPATGGTPMPPGGMLPEATRDILRGWIDQGCPP